MRAILAAAILLVGAKPVGAETRAGRLGAGLELGEQNGVTAKYWTTDDQAIAGGLGASAGLLSTHGEYLWHTWRLFPKPPKGELAGHLGLGGRLRDDELGLRPSVGIGYWFAQSPVEVFLDAGPIIALTHRRGTDLTASIGVRAYLPARKR